MTGVLTYFLQAELKKTMIDETLPKFCCYFEKRLCENCEGKGFFVGNEVR